MRSRATWMVGSAVAIGLSSALVVGGYFAMLSFSDSKTMSPRSLAALLLVPDVLKANNLREIGTVTAYRYSAADGPKPSTVIARIDSRLPQSEIEGRVRSRFSQAGFTSADGHTLIRGNEEIAWSYLPEQGGEAALEIALLTYVK